MSHSVHGIAQLEAYRPLDAAAYLRTRGWEKVHEATNLYSIWMYSEGKETYEVLLPLALNAPDLGRRVRELIETLTIQEGRTSGEILEDLSSSSSDVIRLRLLGGTSDHTLPLEDGSAAFQHTRDLLLAAACTAWRPKGLYGPRKPEEALDFIRRSRLAPSHAGSYVIKVIAPLVAGDGSARQTPLFSSDDSDSFSRRTTMSLAIATQNALDAALETATTGQIESESSRIAGGVSANFCAALAGLCRIGNGLDLNVSWASALPPRKGLISRIRLSGDVVIHLEKLARNLRQSSELDDADFRGVVYRHTVNDEDTDEVILNGDLAGTPRSLRALVDGELRQRMLQAFNERRVVSCVGEVVKKGKFYWMRNLRSMQIFSTEDEDESVEGSDS